MSERTEKREVWTCVACDLFELEKKFSGVAGTPGEEEYNRIEPPDECPACGGMVERSVESEGEP